MKKNNEIRGREEILRGINEDVDIAIDNGAGLDMKSIHDTYMNDVVWSVPLPEMVSLWIYQHAATRANQKGMYSIGDGIFVYHKKATLEQIVTMTANAIGRGESADATINKFIDDAEQIWMADKDGNLHVAGKAEIRDEIIKRAMQKRVKEA